MKQDLDKEKKDYLSKLDQNRGEKLFSPYLLFATQIYSNLKKNNKNFTDKKVSLLELKEMEPYLIPVLNDIYQADYPIDEDDIKHISAELVFARDAYERGRMISFKGRQNIPPLSFRFLPLLEPIAFHLYTTMTGTQPIQGTTPHILILPSPVENKLDEQKVIVLIALNPLYLLQTGQISKESITKINTRDLIFTTLDFIDLNEQPGFSKGVIISIILESYDQRSNDEEFKTDLAITLEGMLMAGEIREMQLRDGRRVCVRNNAILN